MKIGEWVRRVYDSSAYRNTKWHLVESVIAGAAVTRCGRRLEPVTPAKAANRLEDTPVMPLTRMIGQPQLCRPCSV